MLKLRDIVRDARTGRSGVIVPALYPLLVEEKLSVLYYGEEFSEVIDDVNRDDLEVIGREEPVASNAGCGGEGKAVCAFFAHGKCMRHSSDHWRYASTFRREPTEPYPFCKREGARDAAA